MSCPRYRWTMAWSCRRASAAFCRHIRRVRPDRPRPGHPGSGEIDCPATQPRIPRPPISTRRQNKCFLTIASCRPSRQGVRVIGNVLTEILDLFGPAYFVLSVQQKAASELLNPREDVRGQRIELVDHCRSASVPMLASNRPMPVAGNLPSTFGRSHSGAKPVIGLSAGREQ
jgi:hypothetical protein